MADKTPDYMIQDCTCGRKVYDFTDLAVIIEDDGAYFNGGGPRREGKKSKVVCMRAGCRGTWKSCKKYMKGLTRIFNNDYIKKVRKEAESK
jgi:uncharacterized cupin superfamily protein